LEGSELKALQQIQNRLNQGEPLQYILGEVSFAGMTLQCTPAALIPRPETEELALHVSQLQLPNEPVMVDVGTGSGCLILAAGKAFPSAILHAVDYSADALALAQTNAQRNGLQAHWHHVDFLNPSNWASLPPADLLISNPPYIASAERDAMRSHVLNHEPHLALFAGEDPLVFYRAIASFAPLKLQSKGFLALEINAAWAEETLSLFQIPGFQAELRVDGFDRPRFIIAQKIT
jgi:release factor glutamine methyltransferase